MGPPFLPTTIGISGALENGKKRTSRRASGELLLTGNHMYLFSRLMWGSV